MFDEKDLQKELEKIYNSKFEIKVKWADFRFFKVNISIKIENEIYFGGFNALIEPTTTLDNNVRNISEKIDNLILSFLYV